MRLQITEAGKAKVVTLAFAKKIRKFTEEIQEAGGNEETQKRLAVYVIAKALTETEDVIVDTGELEEFARIHARDIETVISKHLDTLLVWELLEDIEGLDP